jgi:DNA-directed RNA polymerase specialized sigma24 family protein
MADTETHGSSPGGYFKTTRWTEVRKAGDSASPSVKEALEQLCCDYWYPLYAYIRRKGYSVEDAEDLTQAFFCRLIGKNSIQRADPALGRFRTFLLSSLENFLINEWKKRMRPNAAESIFLFLGKHYRRKTVMPRSRSPISAPRNSMIGAGR